MFVDPQGFLQISNLKKARGSSAGQACALPQSPGPSPAREGQHPYLGLVEVLHGHGDDIDANDEGDEEVQIVACAEGVDVFPGRRIVGIVWPPLGFCKKKMHSS